MTPAAGSTVPGSMTRADTRESAAAQGTRSASYIDADARQMAAEENLGRVL